MKILGIDIGGTSIKGGIVNSNGQLVSKTFSLPIDKNKNQEQQIKDLIEIIKETFSSSEFDGIGLGIPGAVNASIGVVEFAGNLNWHNLEIVKLFKEQFVDKQIRITNDANAAALGETKFGSAKNEKNVVLVTLGTGVGGGIIIDGKLYEGEHSRGAELGHITLVMDGTQCTCGRKGCWEMYASATALCNQAKEAIKQNPECLLSKKYKEEQKINGKLIFETAKEGCEVANKVVDNYVKYLCEGLLNICNLFRPSSIILSGGIANQGDYLLNKVKQYLIDHDYGFKPVCPVDIRIASLGYNSGIIGAASLLF